MERKEFLSSFVAARRVSTPLIAISTPDGNSTLNTILALMPSKDNVVMKWDISTGLSGVNPSGKRLVKVLFENPMQSIRPSDTLEKMLTTTEKALEEGVLCIFNAHRIWNDETVVQAIWNLRDKFKSQGSTLVLFTLAGVKLPAELQQDVTFLDEPLPNAQELATIINRTFEDAELKPLKAESLEKAVDAVIGLPAFQAEQSTAMSLSTAGLDYNRLWERKRQVVEQTPGLSILRGTEKFDAIGGVQNAKNYFRKLLTGKQPPRAVVFIDEIEKAFAGTGTDLSGVKSEMTGTMLTWMQDHDAIGSVFIGPPGCTKSMLGKSIGNEGGIPTIAFDFGGMQSSLVGSSGERLRGALKVVEAVSQGQALFVATCNSISALPPELRRRFNLGTFFFDLPNPEEREVIWKIYLTKYKLTDMKRPKDEGWTGAEIKNCCHNAWLFDYTLEEAARFIVPVAKSAEEQIKGLRKQAHEKYISASGSGAYQYEELEEISAPSKARMIRLEVPAVKGTKGGSGYDA